MEHFGPILADSARDVPSHAFLGHIQSAKKRVPNCSARVAARIQMIDASGDLGVPKSVVLRDVSLPTGFRMLIHSLRSIAEHGVPMVRKS